MNIYMVIDVGTSSLRVALLDEKYRICRIESMERTVDLCMDADKEWDNLLSLIAKIDFSDYNVKGISISSLLAWVAVDSSGAAVTPCYTYMHKESEAYEKFMEEDGEHAQMISRVCCRKPASEQLAFKMKAIKHNSPDLYRRIKGFVSLKDYFNMKLSGGDCIIDHTTACYSLLFDVRKREWSDSCIEIFGLSKDVLPVVKAPWEVVGMLDKAWADAWGVAAECPVIAGSVDGSCGILGAGGNFAGAFVSVKGTTDTSFVVSDRFPELDDESLIVNPHVYPGCYLVGGPTGMSGGAVGWFMHTLLRDSMSFAEANRLAQAVSPGANGVVAMACLEGERTPFWISEMRGTFLGIAACHGAGHLFRSLIESNCYTTRYMMEMLRRCGVEISRVIIAGGCAKSELWLKILACVLQQKVERSKTREASLLGAAMLIDLSCHNDYKGGVEIDYVAEAGADEARQYNTLYEEYMKIHDEIVLMYRRR